MVVLLPRPVAAISCAMLTAAVLLAHGGQYRGPWNGPAGPGPYGPGTGGPAGPSTGGPLGPTTGPLGGGRPAVADGTSWQVWWEFSKDPLIARPGLPETMPVSGSDEFYLGVRRQTLSRDPQAPTEPERRDRIAAALLKALRGNTNPDIVTACLVALGKVGLDPQGAELHKVFPEYLPANNQEIRETSALAPGIAGRADNFDTLAALLHAEKAGRALCGGEVSDRTRTFAAWSLGLMARRSDGAVKQRVHDLLLHCLMSREERSRDLRVGLVGALGLLAPDPERSAVEKKLLWQTVASLWTFYEQDLGKGNQLVQAHAPIAIARLLGRGNTPEHQRRKGQLLDELFPRQRRNNTVLQSAAMALGTLCLPQEQHPDDAVYSEALLRYYKEGTDQAARHFSVLSLGRIGGAHNRAVLLAIYGQSNKHIERPWIALALGLIARQQVRLRNDVDTEVGRLLLYDLREIDSADTRAALSVAIGLCGYREAADTLLELIRDHPKSDMVCGYVPLALAMLDHAPAADALLELMQQSLRRPFVLQQCAVALGRLGDLRAAPVLHEMLQKSDSMAVLSAVATGIGYLRDRRSIDPMIAALEDPERTKLARAFAAAALGFIGDKDLLPWNAGVADGINYLATVDTLTNGMTGVLDIL